MMAQKLFGTDGIRGVAGKYPLDRDTVARIGTSLAERISENLGRRARFVIGRDTRESGEELENALAGGVKAAGSTIESAGVITTPGVAFLTHSYEFDAGIVVSASHNPYHDNGIKVFLPSGMKMGEQMERVIEADIASNERVPIGGVPERRRAGEFQAAYRAHLTDQFPRLDLSRRKVVLDLANGAAAAFAPGIFAAFGADVICSHDKPDGRNINHNCGSLHLDGLRRTTVENGADIGIAFDGDADRALFVDQLGNIVDGDAVLWILACFFQEKDELASEAVVATVMSNIGLELALASRGIKLLRTAVGDKYVLEELLRSGSELGGEQSGHIILPKESLVGDGIMTALFLAEAMHESGKSLSDLASGFVRYPQTLVNVRVREKKPFESDVDIEAASTQIADELDGKGRLLLRYSGTENLARVMIEGKDQQSIESQARRLADVISTKLG